MTSENGVVPKNWRCAVIIPLYKSNRERTECKNYRCISLLNIVVVGKLYARILVDRVCRVNGVMIDDEQSRLVRKHTIGEIRKLCGKC